MSLNVLVPVQQYQSRFKPRHLSAVGGETLELGDRTLAAFGAERLSVGETLKTLWRAFSADVMKQQSLWGPEAQTQRALQDALPEDELTAPLKQSALFWCLLVS